MKTAIDFYDRGKMKESSADEYSSGGYYFKGRFICPECGEPVHISRSRYSNFFSHFQKTESSVECDRRVDGVTNSSIYERMGVPIYLRDNGNATFNLVFGFKKIPSHILNKAIEDKASLKIEPNCGVYRISNERFSSEDSTFIDIDYIPQYGMDYKIEYKSSNASILKKHWSDYGEGFATGGSLFSVSNIGGRKIRHGDTVSTEEDYYMVRKQKNYYDRNGLSSEFVGTVILKNEKWNVFKIRFDSLISDTNFMLLQLYVREFFKVNLVEKKPEFIPLWPPVNKTEDGYAICDNQIKEIRGLVSSGNEMPRIYKFDGVQAEPLELKSKNGILKLDITSNDMFINVDRKYVSNGTRLYRKNIKQDYAYKSDCFYYIDDKKQVIKDILNIYDIENLKLESNLLQKLVCINKHGNINIKEFNNQLNVDDLNNFDSLYIISGFRITNIIKIFFSEADKNVDYSDFIIKFHKYNCGKKVCIPYKTRVLLSKLVSYGVCSEEINEIIREGKVSLPIIKLLEGVNI